MKKLLPIILLSVSFLLFETGCGSTPQAKAVQIAGVQVLTVNTAMHAWADWVNGGHATQQQADDVKALYQKYYMAALVEKKAMQTYLAQVGTTNAPPASASWQAAGAALAATEGDLIALVSKFQGK